MPRYEKENIITVETIFGLIDFDKFKECILRYKKDSGSGSPIDTPSQELGKQDEQVFFKYDKEDPDDSKTGWVKK